MSIAIAAVGIAGCTSSGTSAPPAVAPAITDAWVRPPSVAGGAGAAYLTITNSGGAPDALVGASSPIATSCSLHETSMDSAGMTGMHQVGRLEIPAGGTVKLEPGGYHLMLMGMDDLIAGSTFELRLDFERAGTVVVKVTAPQG